MNKVTRPSFVTDEHLAYLDERKKDGLPLHSAVPSLEIEFDIFKQQSKEILGYWMASFSERQRSK